MGKRGRTQSGGRALFFTAAVLAALVASVAAASASAPGDLVLVNTDPSGSPVPIEAPSPWSGDGTRFALATQPSFPSGAWALGPEGPGTYIIGPEAGNRVFVQPWSDGVSQERVLPVRLNNDGTKAVHSASPQFPFAGGGYNVYVKEDFAAGGKGTLVTAEPSGAPARTGAQGAMASADLGMIAFQTTAPMGPETSDCVIRTSPSPPRASCPYQAYVKNMQTGVLTLLSRAVVPEGPSGAFRGNAASAPIAISDDGTRVLFISGATNLVADPQPVVSPGHIPVYERALPSGGNQAGAVTYAGEVIADSNRIFSGDLSLVGYCGASPEDGSYQVLIEDWQAGVVRVASESADGVAATGIVGACIVSSFSADGTKVAFATDGTGLSINDTDALIDSYVKDLVTGEVELASVTSTGVKGNEHSALTQVGSLDPTGQKVLIYSQSTNFDPRMGGCCFQGLYIKTLGTALGPADTDGDGVPDSLDVDIASPPGSVGFSDAVSPASPALGIGTYGVIAPNGLDVAVEDLDPGSASSAVRISVSGSGTGPVEVTPCGVGTTLYLDAGDTVTVDCGSVTITVEAGNGITGQFGNSGFAVPGGTTVTFDATGQSLLVNVSSGGPVTVTVDLPGGDAVVTFPAGTSGTIRPSGDLTGVSGQGVTLTLGGVEVPVSAGGLHLILGGTGNNVINGTAGDDLIIDAAGNNMIKSLGGNDTIITGAGNDTIEGGDGSDTIDAGNGNNVVKSGAGNDTTKTGSGNDTVDAGDGDDTIDAGNGNNVVNAGTGNDTVTVGTGNDTIDAGDGNDTIDAGNGNNVVNAGSGNDTIRAGSGNDTIDGGAGTLDLCNAGGGKNTVKNCEGTP